MQTSTGWRIWKREVWITMGVTSASSKVLLWHLINTPSESVPTFRVNPSSQILLERPIFMMIYWFKFCCCCKNDEIWLTGYFVKWNNRQLENQPRVMSRTKFEHFHSLPIQVNKKPNWSPKDDPERLSCGVWCAPGRFSCYFSHAKKSIETLRNCAGQKYLSDLRRVRCGQLAHSLQTPNKCDWEKGQGGTRQSQRRSAFHFLTMSGTQSACARQHARARFIMER